MIVVLHLAASHGDNLAYASSSLYSPIAATVIYVASSDSEIAVGEVMGHCLFTLHPHRELYH